jgi:hypothetical protein
MLEPEHADLSISAATFTSIRLKRFGCRFAGGGTIAAPPPDTDSIYLGD